MMCRAQTLRDQLGLVPSTKSKIEDGSDTGTLRPQVVTVADFRKLLRFGPQLVPRFPHSARPSAPSAASLGTVHGWLKKPWIGGSHVAPFSSVNREDLLHLVPFTRSLNAARRRARAHP